MAAAIPSAPYTAFDAFGRRLRDKDPEERTKSLKLAKEMESKAVKKREKKRSQNLKLRFHEIQRQLPKRVALIWAQSANAIIGRGNQIPSEFPSDLARFKAITMGHTVVMGRKTWESLSVKPLPGRANVVLTNDRTYQVPEGVQVIHDYTDLKVQGDTVFFIGGGKVYEDMLPHANELHITVNGIDVEGDVYAPEVYPERLTRMEGWETIEKTETEVNGVSTGYWALKKSEPLSTQE